MVKEKVKKGKGTGHATNIILHWSGTMEWEAQNIELNKLSLFVGQNGVGKSMIMKISWVLQMISQMVVGKVPDLKTGAQFIMDKSIPDLEGMAILGLRFETGAIINVNLSRGKVSDVNYEGFEDITELTSCTYMSSDMRLFSSIKMYLMMRKMIGAGIPLPEPAMLKMLENFKLYDLLYIEGLLNKMPLTLDEDTKKSLHAMGVENLTGIEFNGEDFVGTFAGVKKPLSQLGNGDQSIINMLIAGTI